MESYPQYKHIQSSLDIDIPSHWNVKKLRHLTYMKGRIGWQGLKQSEFTDEGPYLITGMNFKDGRIRWDEVYHITEERYAEAPEIHLRVDDVLMTKDGTIGKLLYVDSLPDRASLNSHLLLLRPFNGVFVPKYLYYQLDSFLFKAHIEQTKTGTTFYGITQDEVGRYKITVPPLPEQQTIVAYLDDKTRKIDTLIEMKQRLIKLLREQRIAIINQAVTKGINPNVNMKDSGNEWIGEIPTHWGMMRLSKIVCKMRNGYVGPTRDILLDEGIRYLQSLHIKDGQIKFHKPYFVSTEWSKQHSETILEKDDVLLVQTGDIGQCADVPEEFVGCNCHALIIIRVKEEISDGLYLSAFLQSHIAQQVLLSIQTGALHPHLEIGKVKDMDVVLPPKSEQRQILSYITLKSSLISGQIERAQREIGLLQEYRTALISEVVTGKIDVRDYAIGKSN